MKKKFYIPLLLVNSILLYTMICFIVSNHQYQSDIKNNLAAEFSLGGKSFSIAAFKHALNLLPFKTMPFLGDISRQDIHSSIGKTFFKKAALTEDKESENYFELLSKAEEHYQKSVNFNPFNIESAKELAKTIFLLEKAGGNAFNALPFFERLHELGPNIVENHYLIADYFHYKDMEDRLFKTIEHLAKIYPSNYRKLKKKDFYSLKVRPFIKKGLANAINQNINQKHAYFSMSQFLMDEGNIPRAVEYYSQGMKIRPFENSEHHYLSFGKLFLEDKQFEQAFKEFEIILTYSKAPEKILNQIYHSFKKNGLYDEFLRFSQQIESKRGAVKALGIFIARARIELGLFELAKARLIGMNSEKETSEAFYLLSVISEKEKDWDAMELNIQKATIIDPSNCHYYAVFAKSLRQQGKHTQAKIQQDNAGECKKSKKK